MPPRNWRRSPSASRSWRARLVPVRRTAEPLRPWLPPPVQEAIAVTSRATRSMAQFCWRATTLPGAPMHNVEPDALGSRAARREQPDAALHPVAAIHRGCAAPGRLKTADALPGERDLAKQLGVSRVTVRKAINGLVKKGVLVQRWGSGHLYRVSGSHRATPVAPVELYRRHVGARPSILGSAAQPLHRPGLAQ